MLGSIASHYYLGYMTVSMFGSNIGPDTSLEVRNTTSPFPDFLTSSLFELSFILVV